MVYIYYDGPRRISKARELRRTLTKAEKTLWDHVRNRKLGGYKIRRQQILNEIIVDFYCTDKRLCIEIDGPYHNESIRQGLDRQRDEELEEHGFTVVRFKNNEVLFDLDRVTKAESEIAPLSREWSGSEASAGEGPGVRWIERKESV